MLHKTTGLVLGKFIPLHKGHELLLTFAQNYVETLYVVVDNVPDSPISGEIRCKWIQQLLPNAKVFYMPCPMPQDPSVHPDFWNIWKSGLINLIPQKPNFVFASEEYGIQLADILDAKFIPVDPQRQVFPVSGSAIKKNIMENWDSLTQVAKNYYLKRICIFGPESTGKTTLTQLLAKHYNTKWVPEYARLFIETQQGISEEDLVHIARGQVALEKAIAPSANRILFCDTDPLSTVIWSQWLYGRCAEEITILAKEQTYDFYLVTYPDLEWKYDSVRYFPEKGNVFFEHCIAALTENKRKFSIISGTNEDRLNAALKHVEGVISCLE